MEGVTALVWSALVSLVVLVVGLAVIEVMRRRGFDPVMMLARPFTPRVAEPSSPAAEGMV